MKTPLSTIAISIILSGCIYPPSNPSINTAKKAINVDVANELPSFKHKLNEIEISDSFNDIDPELILGTVINTKTGQTHIFENFLLKTAKTQSTSKTELLFRKFIQDDLTTSASWLNFLNGKVGKGTKAEVTVMKLGSTSIKSGDIDKAALQAFAATIPKEEREKYNIIIGYNLFTLQASLFKSSDTTSTLSGYGAQIDGVWYSKLEDSQANQRVMALIAPLPFVITEVKKTSDTPLSKLTLDAIDSGKIQVTTPNQETIEISEKSLAIPEN